MNSEEKLHKEIDLIQDCIKRMANNSFLLKGWTISLVSIILTFSPKNISQVFLGSIMLVIVIAFWSLDAYFLRLERMYRKMYNWVLTERKNGNTTYEYDLDPSRFKSQVEKITCVMFSKTLFLFYGVILVPVIIFIFSNLYDYLISKNNIVVLLIN